MAHLALALLGPFQAALDGEPVAPTATRLQALLAYLAVEAEHTHTREALAGLLSPERPDREALTALRYALSNLRRVLRDRRAPRPFVLITRHTVQFDPASDHWLDVAAFLDAVESPGADLDTLERAVALYRGSFLVDVDLADSPAFEEWALLQREQFHRQALTTLQRVAALREARGEHELAAAHARRHLALEPWDEPAHRRLMRLLALGGQRSAALAQYEACRRVLAQELGCAPEDETTALYERIRDGQFVSPGVGGESARSVPHTPAPPRTPIPIPFVGRERELGRLEEHLDAALAGVGRVALVTGEAGSGKTDLVTEFAHRALAAHGDLLFAAGRCSAQAGVGDPYLPFREILQALAGDVETGWGLDAGCLRAALPAVVQALVDAGPDLVDLFVSGAALALHAEAQAPGGAAWRTRLDDLVKRAGGMARSPLPQAALFQQVTRVLQALARQHPLLLVLDDLQWADPGSASLLFHLGRRLAGQRILIVGAYRPADLVLSQSGLRHPLEPLVHEFQREWGDIQVDLDRAAGRAFVDALLDSEPNRLDDQFREQLTRITGGHALFTVELLRSLQDRGDLTRDGAGRWAAGAALDWETLPARVEAIIAERIDRLPSEWQALLAAASVEGDEFTAEVLARVLNASEGVVRRRLGELGRRHRLVRGVGRHAVGGQWLSRYRFRHVLFQRYLYQGLDKAERAGLHEAVGTELGSLHEGVEDLAPRLAWHFEAAGALDKAADYCLQAGHHAYRLSAQEEAIAHYQRGLALLDRLPAPASPEEYLARTRRRLALHLGLGRPLAAARGWGNLEQVHTYERAYELAHELAGQGEMTPEFLQALYMQTDVATGQGAYQQALALSEQLMALAQRSGDPLALGLAHWSLGSSYLVRGSGVAAREHLETALALYRRQPSRFPAFAGSDMGVNCLSWLSLTLCTLGYPEQALARGREALALARALGWPLSLGMALAVAGCGMHLHCRQVQAVQERAAELLALADETDLVLFCGWVELALGWCQVEAGEFQAGLARMWRGADAWRQMGTVPGQFLNLALLAEACCKAGEVCRGLDCIDEALALMRRVGCCNHEPEIHRVRGELLLSGQRLAVGSQPAVVERQAEECFRRAIEIARRQEVRWWELRATTSLARLWQRQGKPWEAHQLLAAVYDWFVEGFDTPDLVEARALLAELG